MESPSRFWSDDEAAQLVELRALVQADLETCLTERQRDFKELTGDVRMLRFLRGYKHKLNEAADAYRKMLAWYKEDKMGDIRDDIVRNDLTLAMLPNSEAIMKYYLANVWHNEDKHGSPISIEMTGQIDPVPFIENIPEEMFLNWHRYHLELKSLYLDKESYKRQRLVRSFMIRDLRGLGLKHANQTILSTLRKALKIGTDNYPESLETVLIINSPSVFNMLWKLVKPMLNQQTLDKIHIFGQSGYQSLIRKHVDPKSVPVFLGGQCSSCEGGCIKNWTPNTEDVHGLELVDIGRGAKYEQSMEIAACCEISWSYTLKYYDIPFTATFQPDDEDNIETVVSETATAETNYKGSYKAARPGQLVLCWNNSGSILRSKSISFRVDVIDVGTVTVPESKDDSGNENESANEDAS